MVVLTTDEKEKKDLPDFDEQVYHFQMPLAGPSARKRNRAELHGEVKEMEQTQKKLKIE